MSRIAVVTGANQGLGYALVEGLCRAMASDDVVYLTCRNEARGSRRHLIGIRATALGCHRTLT
jgi:NAD(P)-dependent dehydrogenase (short-subunit alcohol dehydrogenase family)